MNAFDASFLPATRSASTAWAEALAATGAIEAKPKRLLVDILAEQAEKTPTAAALLSDREAYSFAELVARADGWFAWAIAQGFQPGDTVALLMPNRPAYVALWLGLSKAGVITALINTSLTGASLAHCLKVADPRCIIADGALLDHVAAIRETVPACPLLAHDEIVLPKGPLPQRPHVTISDRALLIYTSGTTGLPKAAHVSHRRILNWALWFKGFLGNTAADRMYDCLPLYHSVGGIVAVAATLVAGGSTVIAPKFSASRFWSDIRRWDCSQVQYIGELCRYLLNAAEDGADTHHRLRVAVGNGLRADVWEAFAARFAIPQIVEFYAATEGSFSLFNGDGKPGSIGRVPPFLRHRFPTAIVKFDHDRGEPCRDATGFCIRADHDEAGEALGRIGSGEGSGRFEGYTDPRASESKILRNVFAEGDAWFRTGDLMRMDRQGYYYFVDRIGDTFRWKGENVSTLEVANVLSGVPGVDDAVVYGVAVPGQDGRAGMALLMTGEAFSLAELEARVAAELPAYAAPLFLRLGAAVALTETFKHRKQDLLRDGFDPARTDDPLYVRVEGRYLRLGPGLHAGIVSGAMRL